MPAITKSTTLLNVNEQISNMCAYNYLAGQVRYLNDLSIEYSKNMSFSHAAMS